MKKEQYKALNALTCAAMSLPGMVVQKAAAEAPPDKTTASYRFTSYGEADFSGDSQTGLPGVERYGIAVHQFLISGAASENKGFTVVAGREAMTGASPWYVLNSNDRPVQIYSGATIEEERTDINVSMDFFGKDYKFSVGGGHSTENDYKSFSGSVANTFWFNNKDTTLDISAAISLDDVSPTQDPLLDPDRLTGGDKSSMSFSIGSSQVINKNLLIGGSFNYTEYDGFLTDSYKKVFIESTSTLIPENRPSIRKQTAFNLQARQFVPQLNGALHADVRQFSTDWGTNSITYNFAWYQNIGQFQIVPRIRYYDQTAANFFRNYYTNERADGYYSSDYRLSAYSAVSFRIKASWITDRGALHASFEAYETSGTGDDPQTGTSPGLVDFGFITIGFDVRW